MNGGVKSALRVLDVLELLSALSWPLGVSAVARRLAIPKSSAQALLTTLAQRGYLDRAGSDYALAAHLRQGSWVGGIANDLLRIGRPIMEIIVARSGESSFLGILTSDGQLQYVAKVVSPNPVRYDTDIVPARPAFCTSAGLAILAHRNEADRARALAPALLTRITPHTITDRAELQGLMEAARRQGHVEIVDGHVEGASGISAPIFDGRGVAVGALNLGAPSSRYVRERDLLREQVVWGASEISRMLQAISADAPQVVRAHTPGADAVPRRPQSIDRRKRRQND
jgi:IclR family pca regulon transcriptional regulator